MMQPAHRVTSHHNRTQPVATQESSGTVNELILSGQPWQSGHILTPVLNELARDQERRWLTLILSDENASDTKNWLKTCGISSNRIQILNPRNSKKSLELTLKALASGTSHTVVSWLNQLDNSWLEKLESAARSGHCQGLAIRKREAA